MTDRPIIFSAPMVRALLDGRKTQTRRMLKPQPFNLMRINCRYFDPDTGRDERALARYRVGDRLWVRENIALPRNWVKYGPVYYAADKHFFMNQTFDVEHLRPSIHMPRWASRLTLIVTGVKVERLQDISEEDAREEGVYPAAVYGGHVQSWLPAEDLRETFHSTASAAFADLWGRINGPDAWDANPWVVAISFTVHRCNIDALKEEARDGA